MIRLNVVKKVLKNTAVFRSKVLTCIILVSFLLSGCNNASGSRKADDIKNKNWEAAIVTTKADESASASGEKSIAGTEKPKDSSTQNGETKYHEYAEGETYTAHVAKDGTVYELVYTQHSMDIINIPKNIEYKKIGETFTYNGWEVTFEQVEFSDSWNVLYDMTDKTTADSYIQRIKGGDFNGIYSHDIDSDNNVIFHTSSDPIDWSNPENIEYARFMGGYKIGCLFVKMKIKNVSGEKRTQELRPNAYLKHDFDDIQGKYTCSGLEVYFLGQHDPVFKERIGLYSYFGNVVMEDGEEREVIFPQLFQYTTDSEINYGRDYIYEYNYYVYMKFLDGEDGMGGAINMLPDDIVAIKLLDHGVVCGNGKKIE